MQKKNKRVSTVIDHSINDNGYSYNEFCDFYNFDTNKLMHIIGGHKRNEQICELLSRTLLNKYPEYYERIVKLFPNEHKRLGKNKNIIQNPLSETQKNIRQYGNFLNKEFRKWDKIPNSKLFDQEQKTCNYFHFLNSPVKKQRATDISRNPYLSIYETKDWNLDTRNLIKNRVSREYQFDQFDIACIPSVLHNGYREILINDLCYNILILLQKPQCFSFLLKTMKKYLPADIQKNQQLIRSLVLQTLEYLFYNKLIYIE